MTTAGLEEDSETRLFQIAIRRHHDALMDLSPYRLRRYLEGGLPGGIRWMLRFPALLRDLADLIEGARQQTSGEGKEEKLRE